MFSLFNKPNPYILNRKSLNAFKASRQDKKAVHLCNAPFRSMLFIPTGEMMVCHYNRGYKLGSFPQQSIGEVWFGEKLNKLRKHLSQRDFSQGCQRCYNDINLGNYGSVGVVKYDFIPDTPDNYPALMEFQLSNKCNLECIMCSGEYSSGIRTNREKGPEYMSPFNDSFVEQLKPFIPHLTKAYFTGGEPFIIPIYKKIWDLFISENPNIEINISTNASFIDEGTKEMLEKGNFNFTISIDSINPENYRKIRKKGDLQAVLNNIDYLHKHAKQRGRLLSVKFIIIRQNAEDITTLFNHFNNKGIQLYPKLVDLPYKHSLYSMDAPLLEVLIQRYSAQEFENDTTLKQENNRRFSEVINQLKQWHEVMLKRPQDTFLSTATTMQIKEALLINLTANIKDNPTIADNAKETLLGDMKQLFDSADVLITDNAALRKAYYAFYVQNPNLIVDEFLRGHTEKLKARFLEETRQ